MKRKCLAVLLAVTMVFTMAGCGSKDKEVNGDSSTEVTDVISHKEWQKTKKWKNLVKAEKSRKYNVSKAYQKINCHFKWERKIG